MFVVIFRARMSQLDDEYLALARQLRKLALREFGCVEFESVSEGDREIALSYWRSESDIRAWKMQADHLGAQRLGQARWYVDYQVQIAEVGRDYRRGAAD